MFASTAADATPARAGVTKATAGLPTVSATRIDGGIRARFRNGVLRAPGRSSTMRDGTLGVVLRFSSSPSPARLSELEAAGVRFTRREPTLSGAYIAHVDGRGLAALEGASDITRVSADELVHAPRPLDGSDVTALREIGAVNTMRAFRAKDGKEIDGTGTVIGDLDSELFVFHPALFRADAGYHAFVDADGDGALTIDVDGIDLDGDGELSDAEILRRLPQGQVGEDRKTPKKWIASEISTARDLVYLDTNGNGKRDYGKRFGEDAAAYGEPLFVLDDADGDGKLSADEKLVQLGTSKIRGVLSADGEYLRGDKKNPLVGYEVASIGDGAGSQWQQVFAEAGHGTLSAGVLVGGQARGQELRGVAPGAELLVASSRGDVVAGLQWLVDHGANVLLTEFAPYVGVSLDGSSEVETFLDAARKKGILVVSPAGNLATSKRHLGVDLSSGSNIVPLVAAAGFRGAHGIYASFHHRGDGRKVGLRVRNGVGDWISVPFEGGSTAIADGITADAYENTTPRGTHEVHLMISSASPFSPTGGDPLPTTKWEIDLVLDAGAPLHVDGYIADDVTPWAGGIAFEKGTGDRTICNPATADSAIRVAAYSLADDEAWKQKAGEIESYSSRGPLLFDRGNIHLAAPTNVLAPVTPFEQGVAAWYVYGGTSGAGPHVAGAVALLRQAMPGASPDQIEKQLVDGTRSDDLVTKSGPNAFGRGRLDVAGALGVAAYAVSTECTRRPSVVVDGDGTADATLRLDAEAEAANKLRVRWDLDYDGVPDTEWEPYAPRSFAGTGTGQKWVRLDVLDAEGCLGSTTSRFDVGDAPVASTPPREVVTESGCACRAGGPIRSNAHAATALILAVATMLVRARRRRGVTYRADRA